MKSLECLLFVTVLAFLASQSVLARSHRHRSGAEGGRRNNSKNRSGKSARNEGFRCPEMACPPVNPTCRNVEYLILQFAEVDSRSDVIFECRGCDYCIDFRSLQKRDARRHHSVDSKRHLRRGFECPGVSESCSDVRDVDVLLSNSTEGRSWSCPACFDNVPLDRH